MSDLSTVSRLLDALHADMQADEVAHTLQKARHALENAQASLDEQARRYPAHVFKRNGRLLVLRDPATPVELLIASDTLRHAERTLSRLQPQNIPPHLATPARIHRADLHVDSIATLCIARERHAAELAGHMYLSGD